MKKTQVALAALALVASTATLAEVTTYGTIDASVATTSKGVGSYLEQGAWTSASFLGFKGSEDLGNGLKANFNLESGFGLNGDVANGGNNGGLFSRLANVGLSSDSLGAVSLGMQLSPFIASAAGSTAGVGNFFVNRIIMGTGGAAAGCLAANTCTNQIGGFFINNAVSYTSPSIAGFTATVLTTAKGTADNSAEDRIGLITRNTGNDNYTSAAINGSVSGVNLTAAHEERRGSFKNYNIGGSYAIVDGLTVAGSYMNHKPEAGDSVKSYSISGTYALTSTVNLIAQFARSDQYLNANENATLKNLAASYTLSKRTALYASYTDGKNVQSAIGNRGASTTPSTNTYNVGVVHSF